MNSKQLFKALSNRTSLSLRSDFLKRDEAYKWLIESAQQGKWDSFNHILTELMFDMSGPLVANYTFSNEDVMDYMLSEMENDLEIEDCAFPFGQPLRNVEQVDRTRKRVFVLGVYSSAVHARWVGTDGKDKVRALAVASEPSIFWRGEHAEEIISNINFPNELGTLVPANLNGPSGNSLDRLYLHPLGLDRDDVWLCDLVPHACLNDSQMKAIQRVYLPLQEQYNLPKVTIPRYPGPKIFRNPRRVKQIIDEINIAQPEVFVTLGDPPIEYFLKRFTGNKKLIELGKDLDSYGRLHPCEIAGRNIFWLPLCHPRQASKLGNSNKDWYQLHQSWINANANEIRLKMSEI